MLEISGIKISWLGHDSFRLSHGGKVIYIDPFKIKGDEKADIVLITHGHYDHCSIEDLKKVVKKDTVFVSTPDTTSKLSGKVEGGTMRLAKPGDRFDIGGVHVEAVPAYNTDKAFHPKDDQWLGYVVTINNVKIYHAGDTDFIPEMAKIKADIALLPVSGTYVMTADEAVKAAEAIRPRIAIPMHYGEIVGSRSDADRFKEKCTACNVMILQKED